MFVGEHPGRVTSADIMSGAGTYCTSTLKHYAHHCAFNTDTVSASAADHCTMDTCDLDHPDEPYLLKRCFGGMEYITNCNQVLRTLEGGAYCQAGAGVHGAAVCSYTTNAAAIQGLSLAVQNNQSTDATENSDTSTVLEKVTETQSTSTASASCPEFTYEGQVIKYKGPGTPAECL